MDPSFSSVAPPTDAPPPPTAPPRKRRRRALWTIMAVLLIVLLLVGATLSGIFWAVRDARGTAWLLATLPRIGIGVQVLEPSGPLVGDFSARQVTVTAGRTKVVVDDPVWKGLSIAYTSYPGTWARLRAESLHASRVTVTVKPSGRTEPAKLPKRLQLPVEIDVKDVAAGEVFVPGLADYPLRDVRGRAHMGLDEGRKHHFDDVTVRAEPLTISGHGHIDATGDLALDVALDAVQADPAGSKPDQVLPAWASALRRDWQGRLRAKGPLAGFDTTLSVKGKGQSLDASAKIEPVAPWPLTKLDLKTQAFDVSALVPRGPMTALTGNVRIDPVDRTQGASGGLRFEGNVINAKPGPWAERHVPIRGLKIDLRGRIRAAGPLDLNTFEALLSDGRREAGVLRGTGHWDSDRFELKADLDQVRPSAVDPGLPAMTLTGPVNAAGTWPEAADGTRASRPTFTAETRLSGRFIDLNRPVQLRLAASGDGQRIDVKTFEATAGGAKAILSGSMERATSAWRLLAKASLIDFDPQPWFPGSLPSSWQTGPHRLNIKAETDLTLPDAPAGAERAKQPVARLATWRGTASAEMPPSVLAGVPLTGSVGLRRTTAADPLHAQAHFDIDGSKLNADGQIAPDATGTRDHWTLEVDAPVLAKLAPVLRLIPAAAESGLLEALGGAVKANAEVTGRWPTVSATGQVQAGALRAGPLSVHKGDVRWNLGTSADGPFDVQISVDQAGWGNQQIGATQLSLRGTPSAHDFSLRTDLKAAPPAWTDGLQQRAQPPGPPPRTLVVANAQGSFTGGMFDGAPGNATPPPLLWKGTLQQLELRSNQPGAAPWLSTRNVGLEVMAGPSPRFVMAAGRADIFTAGLRWDRIEWRPEEGVRTQQLDMHAELEPLAVAPLLARAQPEFGWGGDLRIGGKVLIRQTTDFSADIVLERVSGDLTVTEDSGTQALGLSDLVLALNAHDGVWTFTQGLAGKQLGVASGAFVARTSPQRAWPDANAPLQGVFEAHVENIGTWGAWVPTGWRLGGRLRTTVGLGGRFGAPEYTGQLIGNGVTVRNILEGVNVTDGEADITLHGDTARINRLTARGGAGTVALTGDAQFGESPRARLELTAEKFQLLGRVDRRIVVSGHGDVTLESDHVKVGGKFGVDEGLIDFTRSDAPSLGDDVVVTNRATQEAVAAPTPQRHRDVSIDLAIDLGKNLRLKGRGIDAGLQGDLKITTPNGLPAFTGSIRAVDGTYAAYSQKLNIDRGIITFNGPVNDPRLDIEATRPNLDVRVGVAITGTALNVRVRLFSDPEMSDIDKLSWLMLGRASDGLGSSDTALLQRAAMALLAGDRPGVTEQVLQMFGLDDLSVRQTEGESRDTVVSLGKQLSRRWYVGYERGLNATQGTWQLIYRVAQRFKLRAQSGLDKSLDLIWTWRWD